MPTVIYNFVSLSFYDDKTTGVTASRENRMDLVYLDVWLSNRGRLVLSYGRKLSAD